MRTLQKEQKKGFELPFFVSLPLSGVIAIAAVGSMFEIFNRKPLFGVLPPENPLWLPILAFFAVTGLPVSGKADTISTNENKMQVISSFLLWLQPIDWQNKWTKLTKLENQKGTLTNALDRKSLLKIEEKTFADVLKSNRLGRNEQTTFCTHFVI